MVFNTQGFTAMLISGICQPAETCYITADINNVATAQPRDLAFFSSFIGASIFYSHLLIHKILI